MKWRTLFEGSDVDINGDGEKDAKWIEVFDNSGSLFGRYAVLVNDEASKVNLNTAGLSSSQGLSTYEVNLDSFLSKLEIANSHEMADIALKPALWARRRTWRFEERRQSE